MINVGKRHVAADIYLSALVNSISILYYFQVEEGYGDYLASVLKCFSVELSDRKILHTEFFKKYIIIQAILSRKSMKNLQLPMKKYSLSEAFDCKK